ncbi:MAG: GTPase HflX [Halobacteriota archaeon]
MNHDAVLVERVDPRDQPSLDELRRLVESAGHSVVGELTQKRRPDPEYEIGEGKVEELRRLVDLRDADRVVFDGELGPYQTYNLGVALDVEVVDRFTLILEIFGERAGSRKAQLQVELAELQYELPRADAMASLAKREERPGFMGLGEYDEGRKSDLRDRISRLKTELESLSQRDEKRRRERRRSGCELVAMAGYTNAGKSTLMTALADVETSDHPDVSDAVEPRDELFTTLGTTTRSIDVPGRDVLLSDTVGFISDLPHWLVQSFESTLDEVYLADLVLLVVDASDPVEEMHDKLVTCHDALWDRVEASVVTVFNKADLLSPDELRVRREAAEHLAPDPVVVSARTGEGLDALVERVRDELPSWDTAVVSLPPEDGMSTVSWLHDNADVREVEYGDEIRVEFEAPDDVIARASARAASLVDDDGAEA